jgi:uncharacterized membrane protein YoaK (UPF0700 family)
MAVDFPVSDRLTIACLLLLTFATGIVDAISVLVLGHVFVANMTGNVRFLGFWFAPHSAVDLTAAVVAFPSFVVGAVIGGRMARHLDGTEGAAGRVGLISRYGIRTRHRGHHGRGRRGGPKLQVALMTNLPTWARDHILRQLSGQP